MKKLFKMKVTFFYPRRTARRFYLTLFTALRGGGGGGGFSSSENEVLQTSNVDMCCDEAAARTPKTNK